MKPAPAASICTMTSWAAPAKTMAEASCASQAGTPAASAAMP